MAEGKNTNFGLLRKKLVFHDFHPEISILAKMFIDNYTPWIKFRVEWWQNEVVRVIIMEKGKNTSLALLRKKLFFNDFHPEISILTQMFTENYLPRIKFRVEWWQNEVVRVIIWPKEKIQV